MERIIVRTTSNISYAGNLQENSIFGGDGLVLKPNPELNMLIYIPKKEVNQVISKGCILSYDDFTKQN